MSSHSNEKKSSSPKEDQQHGESDQGNGGLIAKAGELYHKVAAHVDSVLGYEEDSKYHQELLEQGKAGEHAQEKLHQAKEKANEFVENAKEKASNIRDKAHERTSNIREKAQEKASNFREKAHEKTSNFREKAQEKASNIREKAQEKWHGAQHQAKVEGITGDENDSSMDKNKISGGGQEGHQDKKFKQKVQPYQPPPVTHQPQVSDPSHKIPLHDRLEGHKDDEQLPEYMKHNIINTNDKENMKQYNKGHFVTEPVNYTKGKIHGAADDVVQKPLKGEHLSNELPDHHYNTRSHDDHLTNKKLSTLHDGTNEFNSKATRYM